jgi:hypothetical protein
MNRIMLFSIFAPTLLSIAACPAPLSVSSPSSSVRASNDPLCNPQNHCLVGEDDRFRCEEGYRWEEPDNEENFNCILLDTTDKDGNVTEGANTGSETECDDQQDLAYCDGDERVYCALGQWYSQDCTVSGNTCERNSTNQPARCVAPPALVYEISGRAMFEKRPQTTTGLGSTITLPIQQARVILINEQTGDYLTDAHTGLDGRYTITIEAESLEQVSVHILTQDQQREIKVKDCPDADCEFFYTYTLSTAPFVPEVDMNIGTLTATVADLGPAFNILTELQRSVDYSDAVTNQPLGEIWALWADGAVGACEGASCYIGFGVLIITNGPDDSDHYDDMVIGHEFGHLFHDLLSHSDNPGGVHDGSPADPRLAWGEGFGTYLGSQVYNSPIYIDTNGASSFYFDIDQVYFTASMNQDIEQDVSEIMVAGILWDIDRGLNGLSGAGDDPILDVMTQYLIENNFQDRGVAGADLVDFLDGWFCRGHSNLNLIEEAVEDEFTFPYDYDGPSTCF